MDVATAPLDKSHDRTAFSCGVEALDRYLKERAGQDAKSHIAAPFVLTDASGAVVGYYTLSAYSIELSGIPDAISRKLPRYPSVPATLLGRLAVDRAVRGQGLGAALLVDALMRSLEGSRRIASFAVVVDVKDDAAASFYGHFGFLRFKSAANRMFLPMATIELLSREREK